jgi:membrane protease YdiL (CAAX protease family)
VSQLLDPNDPTAADDTPRNLTGWIAFAVMILFVIVMTGAAISKSKPSRLDGHDSEQLVLKQVLSAESLEASLGDAVGGATGNNRELLSKSLDDPISGLVIDSDKDVLASMLYAEMRTYQQRPIPSEHLKILATSKVPQDQAFYRIYSSPKLTRAEADQLVAKLPSEPFVYQAAKVQALEKAGDKSAVTRYVSPIPCIGTVILALGAWPFIGASLAVWMIFRRKLRDKTLELKGIPMDPITVADADRLAIRAAQIFAIFVLSSLLVLLLTVKMKFHLTDAEVGALGGVLTIAAIFWLQRFPIDGKKIQLALLGWNRTNLKRNLWLGFLGFLAEFPVAMFLGQLSVTLLHWLPKPTTPAEALEHTHNLRTVIPILISACIIAPFWEEIAFRGLLFPGLKRLMGGLAPGILLSSIIFASVHPQGVTEWLPLAFIGATSCYLSYQSRSLIPGMVMHCLHNTVLCVLMLLS